MYEWKGAAVTGSDWPLRVECFADEDGNGFKKGDPLPDINPDDPALVIEMQLQDSRNSPLISLTTTDDTITIPEVGVFQWRVTKEKMRVLCAGNTYRFGVRITTAGGTTTIMTGSLAFIDGEFEWR